MEATEKKIKAKIKNVEDNETIKKVRKSQPLTFSAIIIFWGSLFFALLSYPLFPFGYSIRYNWISDIGNPMLNPGASFFNVGIIISGLILAILFTRSTNAIIMIAGIIMSFAAMCIGLFPEHVFFMHSFFADVFFKCCLICIIMTVVSIKGFIRLFGIICILFNAGFLLFFFQPLWEWITFTLNFFFICIICFNN